MRDSRLDLLRVILIVGVICIHTFCVLDLTVYPQYRTWSLVLNTICHYAVPLFVMLSGIVLMDKCDEPFSQFYRKRLTRIIVPTLPAVLFFAALRIFRDGDSALIVLRETLLGRPYYHLWFAFMLFGVYLFMPFLARLVHEVHDGVLALACCLVVCVAHYVGEGPYQIIPYCAYAALGMILARRSRACRRPIAGWCALAVLVFVLNCVPPCFGGVVATRLAALVFGAYLWHPFFKGAAMAVVSRLAPSQMWLVFPVTAITAFAAIYLVSYLRTGAVLLGVVRR